MIYIRISRYAIYSKIAKIKSRETVKTTFTRYSVITKGKHVRYFREHYRLGTSRFRVRVPTTSRFVKAYLYVRGKRHVHEANCDESKVHRAKENKKHKHRLSARKQDNDAIRKKISSYHPLFDVHKYFESTIGSAILFLSLFVI